ncbi:unnamed protein product, partial [Linum tenue]
ESWVLDPKHPRDEPKRERERFEGILGVELEDFFALEARGTSPDLKTDHLKILTAVSLFSME